MHDAPQLARGMVAFLRATLGFEPEVMREGTISKESRHADHDS